MVFDTIKMTIFLKGMAITVIKPMCTIVLNKFVHFKN